LTPLYNNKGADKDCDWRRHEEPDSWPTESESSIDCAQDKFRRSSTWD